MLERFKGWLSAALPAVPPPKAPKDSQTYPGYRTNVVARPSAIPKTDRRLATTDRVLEARGLTETRQVMRSLVKGSPDLSSSVSFLLRTGIPETYSMVSRNMDGSINAEATSLAHELLRRMLYLGNPDGSFGTQLGLQSLSEQLGLELILDGAACLEVGLDKGRIPAALKPVSIPTLKFYEEDKGFRMVQVIGSEEIDLDLPTIIYTSVDQLQSEPYASSYLESAIQPIMTDLEFNNITRRALQRAVLPRLSAILDSEQVKKMTPPEVLANAEDFTKYKNELLASIESVINGLNPEDALVSYDTVSLAYVEGGHDPSAIIERVQKALNSKLVSGAKTLPTILGHGGSNNASSTESLLYLKQANMLRTKLNEMYSRAMTVAVRLMGQDCYVEFVYETLNLRPDSELEAFKSMRQSRVLELLSLGLVSDEEACIQLTGNLPPAGYKPLSGTMFQFKKAEVANPTSNTSAAEQALTSDAPSDAKSTKKPKA